MGIKLLDQSEVNVVNCNFVNNEAYGVAIYTAIPICHITYCNGWNNGTATSYYYYYDLDGSAYFNTLTETVSVYNYVETSIKLSNTEVDSVSGAFFTAGSTNDVGQIFHTSVSAETLHQ